MDMLQLREIMKAITNTDRTYSYEVVGGPFYALHYNGRTGVLKITRNITRDPSELQSLEEAIKDPNHTIIKLRVQPKGEEIIVGRVTKIEYI